LDQVLVAPTCNPSDSEAEIKRITVQSQPGHIVLRDPILKKPITKKMSAEWLKVRALSSSPRTIHTKKGVVGWIMVLKDISSSSNSQCW
jgi:hypothetical protein